MHLRLLLAIALFWSCSSSPEKAIVNRWKATDVKGDGHDRFLLQTAKAKEAGKEPPSKDMEFTKDGKFNAYDEEGVLKTQGTYAMAADGKSLLLQQPNNSQTVSVKILELTSGKLVVTAPEIFGSDTLTMEPR